jgi:hypothetical protein
LLFDALGLDGWARLGGLVAAVLPLGAVAVPVMALLAALITITIVARWTVVLIVLLLWAPAVIRLLTSDLRLVNQLRLVAWFDRSSFRRVIAFVLISIARAAIGLRLHLLLIGLGCCHDAEIVLRILIIALCHNTIAGGLGVAAELQVFVSHGLGGAADFHVRSVAFIDTAERIAAAAATAATSTAATAAMPVSAAFTVLPRSHVISIFRCECSIPAHAVLNAAKPSEAIRDTTQIMSLFNILPVGLRQSFSATGTSGPRDAAPEQRRISKPEPLGAHAPSRLPIRHDHKGQKDLPTRI